MANIGLGSRPTTKAAKMLEWWAPGALYQAETRWFTDGATIAMQGITPTVNYDIAPAAGEQILVNRVTFIVVDSAGGTDWSPTVIGGHTAALTTGIKLALIKDGSEVHDFTSEFTIKNNGDFFCYTSPDYVFQELETGDAMNSCTFDLVGVHAPVLLDSTDDALRVVIADNISVTTLRARADLFVLP